MNFKVQVAGTELACYKIELADERVLYRNETIARFLNMSLHEYIERLIKMIGEDYIFSYGSNITFFPKKTSLDDFEEEFAVELTLIKLGEQNKEVN